MKRVAVFACCLLVVSLFVLSLVHGAEGRKKPKAYERNPTGSAAPSVIKSPLPKTYIDAAKLPKNWDWRNVNGTVYTTKIGNQLAPKFCGSCWGFCSTSAISDRMKIQSKSQKPDMNLAVQVLLDCGQAHGAGGCDGGSSLLAYKFMHDYGITDDTCSPYMAVDYYQMSEAPCEESMCRTCDLDNTCYQVNATRHYVSEYGSIQAHDLDGMMAEIFARGPITCGIYAHSNSFEKYTGGIINDPVKYPYITHCISLVGWGESATGEKYWVGRNSFGTNWGMEGWFLIERGTNCLLVESGCNWGVPASP